MLIVGAGGLAAQLYDDLININAQHIVFWSEVDTKYHFISERYPILKTDEEVIEYFNTISRSFILCISGTENRIMLAERFKKLGGNITSFISAKSTVNAYATIGKGSLVMSRVEIEACVTLGEQCLVNKTANIGHGCIIGANSEISPGVILTGEVQLGENCFVGARAVVLPKLKIGNNVVIAAGSIVKKDVPDNAVVAGEFATVKYFKKNESQHLSNSI